MLIIDLDNPTAKPKREPIQVLDKVPEKPPVKIEAPKAPIVKEILETRPVPLPTDQKEKLIHKLEEEDTYVRMLRAKNHQRFFDLLGPDLRPLPGADFSEICEMQKGYRAQLKMIYLKKEQVLKTGRISEPKCMTSQQIMELSALKHERSNAYKLMSKHKKKLEIAKVKGNTIQENQLIQKMDLLDRDILELSAKIKKIEQDGMVN